MAPKKGNKHALGYGRPPKTYSDDDLIKIGEDMLKWMQEMDNAGLKAVHLTQFYRGVKNISRSEWRSIRKRLCFIPYYERALDWILVHLLTNKDLQTAYGSRYLAIYDLDLREHERAISQEKTDYELTRKQEIEKSRMEHPNDAKLDELIKAVKEKK